MKAIFGGGIAVVLLGIYVHLLRVAYLIVDCASQPGCTARTPADFNDVMAQTLDAANLAATCSSQARQATALLS